MHPSEPLVSCIMPTYNRRAFVPFALEYFLRQDYPSRELIIIDDGTDNISDLVPPGTGNIRYFRLEKKITLGAKLNLACRYAKGNIIANWDDDDWYHPHRLTMQVAAIQQKGIAVCGINKLFYLDLNNKQGYRYVYPHDRKVWLSGSTLCFTRELWQRNAFANVNVGMDGLFVWATPPEQICVMDDPSFSVHMIHDQNVSPKKTAGSYWQEFPLEKIRQILKDDFHHYINDGFHNDMKGTGIKLKLPAIPAKNEYKQLKNVFACLVHENEDCIIDLVRNLHYHDPGSVILLYNGSENPALLSGNFPYEQYGAVVHPSPVPQKHGYLHRFALDCMKFALEHFTFDVFTNVDSDQLCIRQGYTQYLSRFFAGAANVGMLSSSPKRVLPGDRLNHVAARAFLEKELWVPLLSEFPGGEDKFVHWTFWPSTVFSHDAVRDLVNLFEKNESLKTIMDKTKIWATEEVIFPTLVSLLGYEIAANPCSYEYVKYRKNYSVQDMQFALKKEDAFWIHPVERNYGNPLRTFARKQFKEYTRVNTDSHVKLEPGDGFQLNSILINKLKKIEGWLGDDEADLLIELSRKTCLELGKKTNIVEIGSYHGKTTVLFGSVMKKCGSPGKIFAIDTHDGKLGAADAGIKSYPPSFEKFTKNIAEAELGDLVEMIRDRSVNVPWNRDISLLLIDGLHDYANAAMDFWHFEKWIIPGGYVAFHDYADYFPGVKTFVDELSENDKYMKLAQAGTLVVFMKQKLKHIKVYDFLTKFKEHYNV